VLPELGSGAMLRTCCNTLLQKFGGNPFGVSTDTSLRVIFQRQFAMAQRGPAFASFVVLKMGTNVFDVNAVPEAIGYR